MATNINAPFGLRSVGHLLGLNWSDKADIFVIRSDDTAAYWIGDIVTSVAHGDAQGIPAVTKILAGAELTGVPKGVIVGIYPTLPGGAFNFQGTPLALENIPIPAVKSHDWYVLVNTDPYTIFEIQDSGVAALTETACNKNATYVVTNGTSTILAPSATTLNTTLVTTSTYPLRILGLSKNTSSNTYGKYAIWRVRFNLHEAFGQTAGT